MIHNTTHDMYLPDRRAPKRTSRRKLEPGMIGADRLGSTEQRELWMRQRQAALRQRDESARARRFRYLSETGKTEELHKEFDV